MRLFTVLFLTSLCLALGACKTSCRSLSEKLCDCAANSTLKTACLQRAANNEGAATPSEESEDTCERLLPQCDCRLINTAEGKIRCGLAIEPAAD